MVVIEVAKKTKFTKGYAKAHPRLSRDNAVRLGAEIEKTMLDSLASARVSLSRGDYKAGTETPFTLDIVGELCKDFVSARGDAIKICSRTIDRLSCLRTASTYMGFEGIRYRIQETLEDSASQAVKLFRGEVPREIRLAVTVGHMTLMAATRFLSLARQNLIAKNSHNINSEIDDTTGILAAMRSAYIYHPVYNDIYNYISQSHRGYGIVLAGASGTGKSAFTQLLRNTHVVCGKNFKELSREQAVHINKSQGILVIDDVDFLVPKGRDGSTSERGNLKLLLEVLDVAHRVILTTNHPERLDAALTRAGRADKIFNVGYVDRDAAKVILALSVAHEFHNLDYRASYTGKVFEYTEFFLNPAIDCGGLLDRMEELGMFTRDEQGLYPPAELAHSTPRLINSLRTRPEDYIKTSGVREDPLKAWLMPTKFYSIKEACEDKTTRLVEALIDGTDKVWSVTSVIRGLRYEPPSTEQECGSDSYGGGRVSASASTLTRRLTDLLKRAPNMKDNVRMTVADEDDGDDDEE